MHRQAFVCYPATVRFSSSFRVVLVLLLGFALLLTRIGGDHLHLCFDGQESSIALHGADSGLHHDQADGDQRHADEDVDLASVAPPKFKSSHQDGALLLALCVLLLLLPRWRAMHPLLIVTDPIKSALCFLRPPLRGPPL